MDFLWQVIPTHQACSVCGDTLQWGIEAFKTASPLGDQAPCIKNLWNTLEEKKCEQEEQRQLLRASTSTNESAVRVSYLVAKHIATIGEELILLATEDICSELFGVTAVKKIAQVLLSASTVTWRIKIKLRSRLDVSNTLQVSSCITTRWDRLIAEK